MSNRDAAYGPTTRALALRGLAAVATETLALWVRRSLGSSAQADGLSALILLADDVVWDVQHDPAFVTDAARRTEAVARVRAQARAAGLPARDHLLHFAVELTLAGLKATRRLPPNAGAV